MVHTLAEAPRSLLAAAALEVAGNGKYRGAGRKHWAVARKVQGMVHRVQDTAHTDQADQVPYHLGTGYLLAS